MQLATAHLITSLYALSNRLALSPAELEFLDSCGSAFTPSVWRETRETLKLADTGGAGTEFEFGFMPGIFVWLGVRDEAQFVERYGVGIDEALARDRGCLSAAAASLEGDRSSPLALPLSHAWSARAMRLMDELPETGEAVLLTLERALDGCRWDDPEWTRPLFEAIVQVADLIGNEQRSAAARKMLETIDREAAPDESEPIPLGVVTQTLTALYCITHEGLLLGEERVLEPGISGSADAWALIAAAARDGRAGEIPAPVGLLRAWGAPEGLNEEAVRDCLRRCAPLLPQIVAEVSRLWGGSEAVNMDVFEEVARAAAGIALVRHQGLHEGWDPLLGERSSIWFEVHQGAQRPRTVDRAELMRRVRAVLLRADVDPLVVAAAHLDAASETRAEGKHDETRSQLEKVQHWTVLCEDPVRQHYGVACLARQTWLEGDPEEAMRRLRSLEGDHPQRLLRVIEAHADEREQLRRAEEVHAERGDVDTMCKLVAAEIAAGHSLRAEAIARDALQLYPDDPKAWSLVAWSLVAWLLFVTAHYRHALVPALEALDKGIARTAGVTLLARILAHLGSKWSEESARLAVEAIEAHDAREVLPSDVLAELADIVQYNASDIAPARLADDLVLDMATDDPPPVEWLGAAVARRIHGVRADDAPEWLARLADVSQVAPAALGRFVVERVDALLWFRTLIDRELQTAADKHPVESLATWFEEGRRQLARRDARSEAVGSALRAAISLGLAEPELDKSYERSGDHIEAARHWIPNLKSIASCFGDELAVLLRSSELAQETWCGAGEVGESELLLQVATLDRERLAWVRWTGECEAIADLDAITGLTPATKGRLQRMFEFTEADDGKQPRELGWTTAWHEVQER